MSVKELKSVKIKMNNQNQILKYIIYFVFTHIKSTIIYPLVIGYIPNFQNLKQIINITP